MVGTVGSATQGTTFTPAQKKQQDDDSQVRKREEKQAAENAPQPRQAETAGTQKAEAQDNNRRDQSGRQQRGGTLDITV